MDTLNLSRLLAPLLARLNMLVARGVVRLVNDEKKIQALQATFLRGEMREGLEHFQQYGFTSHPMPGAECVTVFLGGHRNNGVVIAVADRRHRLKGLEPGESAQYNHTGSYIKIMADGTIVLSSGTKVRVEAPALECTGTINELVG